MVSLIKYRGVLSRNTCKVSFCGVDCCRMAFLTKVYSIGTLKICLGQVKNSIMAHITSSRTLIKKGRSTVKADRPLSKHHNEN